MPILSAIIGFSLFGSIFSPSTIALIGLWVFFAKSLQLRFHFESRPVARRKVFFLASSFSLKPILNFPLKFDFCSIFVDIFRLSIDTPSRLKYFFYVLNHFSFVFLTVIVSTIRNRLFSDLPSGCLFIQQLEKQISAQTIFRKT